MKFNARRHIQVINAGRLARILNISDVTLAQLANCCNWPREDGQFIVDNLPPDIRKKVIDSLVKEAA